MNPIWIAPGVLQAVAIAVDEFHFHRKRGLAAWEFVGHPLDTVFFLIPLGVSLSFSRSGEALHAYVALATFSSVLVTKDEWVHARVCGEAEHWMHSVLFLLHPAVFFAGAELWEERLRLDPLANVFAKAQFTAASVFLAYQVICWRLSKAERNRLKSGT